MDLITDRPSRYDLTMYKGASFRRILRFRDSSDEPIDLSDYQFTAQIRKHYDAENVILQFQIDQHNQDGQIDIHSETDVQTGSHVWDLKVVYTGGNETQTGVLLYGEVLIRPRVTI